MAGEASEAVAALPAWLQIGANAALFVVAVAGGALALRRGRREGDDEAKDHFGAEEFLESAGVRRFLAAAEDVAANAKLQTEALKTISAAATAMAKTVEADFDERQIIREVERRSLLEKLARERQYSDSAR